MYVSLTFTIKYFRIILRQKKIPVTFTYLQYDIMSRCQKADDILSSLYWAIIFQNSRRENTTDEDKTRSFLFILQFRLESTHNSTIRNRLRRYK
jgi:hypothetical protein